jgi:hypothetical protein
MFAKNVGDNGLNAIAIAGRASAGNYFSAALTSGTVNRQWAFGYASASAVRAVTHW